MPYSFLIRFSKTHPSEIYDNFLFIPITKTYTMQQSQFWFRVIDSFFYGNRILRPSVQILIPVHTITYLFKINLINVLSSMPWLPSCNIVRVRLKTPSSVGETLITQISQSLYHFITFTYQVLFSNTMNQHSSLMTRGTASDPKENCNFNLYG